MKILHFCMDALFMENYSYQDNLLTEYQHKLGHSVRIVTHNKTRDKNGKLAFTQTGFKVLNNGVELVRVKYPSKLRRAIGVYDNLLVQLLEYQPDFVFIHGLCSFVPHTVIKYKKKYQPNLYIVADNHQDTGTTKVKGFPESIIIWLQKQAWKYWIDSVDKVYGTTSWRVTFAKKYYGIPEQKLDTLIMGVDVDRISDDKSFWRQQIRKDLGIKEDAFVFVTGGKLDNNKRILQTLEAFNRVQKNDIVLLIFGDVLDDVKDEFFIIINNNERIRFLGYLSSNEVWKYFYASDFGLFPGRHSVLWEEAIGCGLPCLFHRYEKRDHTEVCGNCICIEQSDVDTIYGNMKKVLVDKEYYAQLKVNAEKASCEFSYHTIAKKSLECCCEDRK